MRFNIRLTLLQTVFHFIYCTQRNIRVLMCDNNPYRATLQCNGGQVIRFDNLQFHIVTDRGTLRDFDTKSCKGQQGSRVLPEADGRGGQLLGSIPIDAGVESVFTRQIVNDCLGKESCSPEINYKDLLSAFSQYRDDDTYKYLTKDINMPLLADIRFTCVEFTSITRICDGKKNNTAQSLSQVSLQSPEYPDPYVTGLCSCKAIISGGSLYTVAVNHIRSVKSETPRDWLAKQIHNDFDATCSLREQDKECPIVTCQKTESSVELSFASVCKSETFAFNKLWINITAIGGAKIDLQCFYADKPKPAAQTDAAGELSSYILQFLLVYAICQFVM